MDKYGAVQKGLTLGMPPGSAGLGARNLLESYEVDNNQQVQRRLLPSEKVLKTLYEVQCNGHSHIGHGRWQDQICIKNIRSPEDHEQTFVTTGSDYGHFPRAAQSLGRPPVGHSLDTKFTHHMASSGMFRNHSLNV